MKIKMKRTMAGPGVHRAAGSIQDVGAEEAKRLIEAGHADPVKATRSTATRKVAEKATVKDAD